jgi:hypothetical protein
MLSYSTGSFLIRFTEVIDLENKELSDKLLCHSKLPHTSSAAGPAGVVHEFLFS